MLYNLDLEITKVTGKKRDKKTFKLKDEPTNPEPSTAVDTAAESSTDVPLEKVARPRVKAKEEARAMNHQMNLWVDFTSFEEASMMQGDAPLCDGLEQTLDRGEVANTFFNTALELHSSGDPATKQFTDLQHFNIF